MTSIGPPGAVATASCSLFKSSAKSISSAAVLDFRVNVLAIFPYCETNHVPVLKYISLEKSITKDHSNVSYDTSQADAPMPGIVCQYLYSDQVLVQTEPRYSGRSGHRLADGWPEELKSLSCLWYYLKCGVQEH